MFILLVYTINSYITLRTFKDTYIGEIFEDTIINELLPLYNPYLGPRLIIIINNAPIYYTI